MQSNTIPAVMPATPEGKQFHVSPQGTPRGDGKKEHPLDLATALSIRSPAKPGDTIWLHGGTYRGPFKADLSGDPDRPIKIRQYPGERAIIDHPVVGNEFGGYENINLVLAGQYLWVMDFEITNSNPNRTGNRPMGLNLSGRGTKAINLIVHDTGVGIFPSSTSESSEVYGCLVYNNGWQDTAAGGTGHGLYFQNETGTKEFRENLVFNNYGWGFHGYATHGGLRGFLIEGNAAFNNGSPSKEKSHPNLLVGGNTAAERISVTENYFYKGSVDLHYTNRNNRDLIFSNNRVFGATEIFYWQSVKINGNVFYFGRSPIVGFVYPPHFEAANYNWNNNTYYYWGDSVPFDITGENFYPFDGWKKRTGFDQNSVFNNTRPVGVEVFLRGNRFENGRANIIVYNWDNTAAVDIDVSAVLKMGSNYEVRNSQDYFGAPVLIGKYEGRALRLPLTGLSIATPIGAAESLQPDPQFNAFVLLKR